MDLRGKRVLVTGAASGIGAETARAFARRGARLVVCDVQDERLAEIEREVGAAGAEVLARRVDVSDRAAMRAFADEVHEGGALDVLVNNAGVAIGGGFLATTLEDWDWIVSINLMGVVHGCHFFLPKMVERGQGGHVVNVSSAAGYMASKDLAAYATTKFGVFGLSEALRDELLPHGIGVSTICPGIVATPITKSMRTRGHMARPGVQDAVDAFYKKRGYGPEKVAAAIVDAVEKRRDVVPVTPEAWAMYVGKRVAPSLAARLGRTLGKRAMKG